jgi:glycosyltransferase involved in cell wall biosynthesis
MKISVIMPCLNSVTTIETQLTALCHQQWDDGWEVIVADNGSCDGTQRLVTRFDGRLPGLRIIDASQRPGAGYARNAAVREAAGEALAFVDADDQVGEGWLSAIGRALLRHDFVASRMDLNKLNVASLAQSMNNVQGRELRRASYPPFLFHAGTSGMGVKRAVHDRIGGFDESLLQRQDTDYCFRIQLQGTALHYAADAVIHVRYQASGGALFRQARRWGRYQALLYKRYGDGAALDHPWHFYFQTWRDLIGCMPRLFKNAQRPAWMKTLGTQIGLLEGAIRYRVPPVCDKYSSQSVADAMTQPAPALLAKFIELDGQVDCQARLVNAEESKINAAGSS